ncbi:MAG: MmcQ/YjbR family DNA-binding protein [Bacteroidota bacterium]|nr:MmcQ/YjbR family DNA-binding protein [Bacteroidota bacterium]
MNIEILREYCLAKQAVSEHLPFDNDTLVYKVAGKMFCLISIKEPDSCNLKCDPEKSIELRLDYQGIKPGYHMDKKHWNTVSFTQDVPEPLIIDLIDQSYQLVCQKLSKKAKIEAGLLDIL